MKRVGKKVWTYGSVALCLLLAAGVLLAAGTQKASAQTETLEEKIVRFTDSDLLDGEQAGGETIQIFAENFIMGQYRPAGYADNYPVTDIMRKVIPTELFCTEGVHAYMGREYGFVVYTFANIGGTGFRNQFLLVDFQIEYGKDEHGQRVPNYLEYRIEPLLQGALDTNNVGGSWAITEPHSYPGFSFKIRNITLGANLFNENEANDGETYYNFEQDKGAVLSFVQMPYKASYDTAGSTGELKKWAAEFLFTKGMDILGDASIPIISQDPK